MVKKLLLITLLIGSSFAGFLTMSEPELLTDYRPHPHPHPPPRPHPSPKDVPEQTNWTPVVGILSLPIHPYEDYDVSGTTYIAGSYVKYIEMAGARVVPIRIDHSFDELENLFGKLNGVLFTGGTADMWKPNSTTPILSEDYAAKACFLFDLVKKANDKGIYTPLWGTCLGFEVLNICASPHFNTMGNFDGEPPYAQSNNFRREAFDSYLFNSFNPHWAEKVMRNMHENKLALLSHQHGIHPEVYDENKDLSAFFRILSTMYDKSGTEFVSIVEAKNYPIYGSQFHPEKNLYEWNTAAIPHSPEAVSMATYFSNFLVSESRRNGNKFLDNTELTSLLIYNWEPYFLDAYFETIYHF